MKKTLFITLLASFAVNAQVREKGEIEIAPFVGFATSKHYGDFVNNNKSLISAAFGVDADFYLNNRWSIKIGAQYQRLGARINTSIGSYLVNDKDVYVKEKISNLAVPLHASYHFGKKRNWYINFGPTLTYTVDYAMENENINVKDLSRRFDGGLGVGVGYKFIINERLSIAIDYQEYVSVPRFTTFSNTTYYSFDGNSSLNVKAVINL